MFMDGTREQGWYPMEGQVLAVLARERSHALDSDLGGVIEVVHHDDPEPGKEKLQHGVAADVAGATRDQDSPRHARWPKERHRSKTAGCERKVKEGF